MCLGLLWMYGERCTPHIYNTQCQHYNSGRALRMARGNIFVAFAVLKGRNVLKPIEEWEIYLFNIAWVISHSTQYYMCVVHCCNRPHLRIHYLLSISIALAIMWSQCTNRTPIHCTQTHTYRKYRKKTRSTIENVFLIEY